MLEIRSVESPAVSRPPPLESTSPGPPASPPSSPPVGGGDPGNVVEVGVVVEVELVVPGWLEVVVMAGLVVEVLTAVELVVVLGLVVDVVGGTLVDEVVGAVVEVVVGVGATTVKCQSWAPKSPPPRSATSETLM